MRRRFDQPRSSILNKPIKYSPILQCKPVGVSYPDEFARLSETVPVWLNVKREHGTVSVSRLGQADCGLYHDLCQRLVRIDPRQVRLAPPQGRDGAPNWSGSRS